MDLSNRTAICLSGQPRFIEICAQRLTEGLKKENIEVDFFLHCWETDTEYSGSKWAPSTEKQTDLETKLQDYYSPIDYIVENQKDDCFRTQTSRLKKNTAAEPFIQASMFYSIYMAGLLRRKHEQKNKSVYQSVVRTRYDFLVVDGLRSLILTPQPQKIYYSDLILNKNVVCDYWMSGTSQTMSEIEEAYFHLFRKDNIWNRQKICGEEILTSLIKQRDLKMQPIQVLGGLVRDEKLTDDRFGKWS